MSGAELEFEGLGPSQKILLGDWRWHRNRGNRGKARWHNTEGAFQDNMLFGDGHVEFFTFPSGKYW